MSYRDQLVTCTACGKQFVFTVTEQRQFDTSGHEIVAPGQCSGCRMTDPETGRSSGRVKWFNLTKGYGFIARSDGKEVFFHRTQVAEGELAALEEGTPVTFESITTARGPEARQVELETF